MSKILISILAFSFLTVFGCTDEYTKNCKDFLEDESRSGYSFAKGSYKDLGEFAEFIYGYKKEIDPTDTTDNIVVGITLLELDDECFIKDFLALKYLPLKMDDTIYIKYSYLGLATDFATASFYIADDDVTIEQYDILEGEGISNWVYIDFINFDTTEINGTFNLSFITTYKPYLTGEKERWDDPNRPDTLHFTNGEFRAVLSED